MELLRYEYIYLSQTVKRSEEDMGEHIATGMQPRIAAASGLGY